MDEAISAFPCVSEMMDAVLSGRVRQSLQHGKRHEEREWQMILSQSGVSCRGLCVDNEELTADRLYSLLSVSRRLTAVTIYSFEIG